MKRYEFKFKYVEQSYFYIRDPKGGRLKLLINAVEWSGYYPNISENVKGRIWVSSQKTYNIEAWFDGLQMTRKYRRLFSVEEEDEMRKNLYDRTKWATAEQVCISRG